MRQAIITAARFIAQRWRCVTKEDNVNPSSFYSQRGMALVVSLVMLAAITLIGVFVMSGSHLEWLMSSNSRFQADAELRAVAALRDGEASVAAIPLNAYPTISNDAFYSHDPAMLDQIPAGADPHAIAAWNNGAFNTQNATTVTAPGTTNEFLVEYMGCSYTGVGNCANPCNSPTPADKCVYTYRIWAYATDAKGTSRIAQSTYSKVVAQVPSTQFFHVGFAEVDHDQAPFP